MTNSTARRVQNWKDAAVRYKIASEIPASPHGREIAELLIFALSDEMQAAQQLLDASRVNQILIGWLDDEDKGEEEGAKNYYFGSIGFFSSSRVDGKITPTSIRIDSTPGVTRQASMEELVRAYRNKNTIDKAMTLVWFIREKLRGIVNSAPVIPCIDI